MQLSVPVSITEKACLVSAHMQETGIRCEMTASQKHFTLQSVHDMVKSPAFSAVVIAITSRQLDFGGRLQRPVTLGRICEQRQI
ncbi:hypothetical protein BDW69DRAFT_175807, partial [Aspergillus filifer]